MLSCFLILVTLLYGTVVIAKVCSFHYNSKSHLNVSSSEYHRLGYEMAACQYIIVAPKQHYITLSLTWLVNFSMEMDKKYHGDMKAVKTALKYPDSKNSFHVPRQYVGESNNTTGSNSVGSAANNRHHQHRPREPPNEHAFWNGSRGHRKEYDDRNRISLNSASQNKLQINSTNSDTLIKSLKKFTNNSNRSILIGDNVRTRKQNAHQEHSDNININNTNNNNKMNLSYRTNIHNHTDPYSDKTFGSVLPNDHDNGQNTNVSIGESCLPVLRIIALHENVEPERIVRTICQPAPMNDMVPQVFHIHARSVKVTFEWIPGYTSAFVLEVDFLEGSHTRNNNGYCAFLCDDFTCLTDQSLLCDGVPDCPDASDETKTAQCLAQPLIRQTGSDFVQILVITVAVVLTLLVIVCVVNHYRVSSRRVWRHERSSRETESLEHTQLTTSGHHTSSSCSEVVYVPNSMPDQLQRQIGALRDKQIRYKSVQTENKLDLPPHIPISDDGEAGYEYGQRSLKVSCDLRREIDRESVIPPPNRTIYNSESPPPYHSPCSSMSELTTTCGCCSDTTCSHSQTSSLTHSTACDCDFSSGLGLHVHVPYYSAHNGSAASRSHSSSSNSSFASISPNSSVNNINRHSQSSRPNLGTVSCNHQSGAAAAGFSSRAEMVPARSRTVSLGSSSSSPRSSISNNTVMLASRRDDSPPEYTSAVLKSELPVR